MTEKTWRDLKWVGVAIWVGMLGLMLMGYWDATHTTSERLEFVGKRVIDLSHRVNRLEHRPFVDYWWERQKDGSLKMNNEWTVPGGLRTNKWDEPLQRPD